MDGDKTCDILLLLAGLEPATFRVLGGHDYHHTTKNLRWHDTVCLKCVEGCCGNGLGCFCHSLVSHSCC